MGLSAQQRAEITYSPAFAIGLWRGSAYCGVHSAPFALYEGRIDCECIDCTKFIYREAAVRP